MSQNRAGGVHFMKEFRITLVTRGFSRPIDTTAKSRSLRLVERVSKMGDAKMS